MQSKEKLQLKISKDVKLWENKSSFSKLITKSTTNNNGSWSLVINLRPNNKRSKIIIAIWRANYLIKINILVHWLRSILKTLIRMPKINISAPSHRLSIVSRYKIHLIKMKTIKKIIYVLNRNHKKTKFSKAIKSWRWICRNLTVGRGSLDLSYKEN